MKIVICGSMSAAKKMFEIGKQLEKVGHSILVPRHTEKYASGELDPETQAESAQNKIKEDLIKDYYHKIANADAVLVVNERKNGIEGYVGGNSFLEMGFAHVLEKQIFILNKVPEIAYKAEIAAMQPVVLQGKLDLIS